MEHDIHQRAQNVTVIIWVHFFYNIKAFAFYKAGSDFYEEDTAVLPWTLLTNIDSRLIFLDAK